MAGVGGRVERREQERENGGKRERERDKINSYLTLTYFKIFH
jgi:hypothetical protein